MLGLCKDLKNTYCLIYFNNFFNNPTLINKLHDEGLCGLGMVRSSRKQIPEMKGGKQTQRDDPQIKSFKNIACIKWMDNGSILMVGSNMENIRPV